MADAIRRLIQISRAPSEKKVFDAWLKLHDAVSFLKDNAREDEFVVYASAQSAFMHAILVPSASVTPPDIEDLKTWNLNPSSSWGIETTFSKPPSISIAPPLSYTGSKTL